MARAPADTAYKLVDLSFVNDLHVDISVGRLYVRCSSEEGLLELEYIHGCDKG